MPHNSLNLQDTLADMRRLDNNLAIRRRGRVKNVVNTEKLRKAEMKLRDGAAGYTPMKFLREASHSFSTSNKKYFGLLIETLDEDPLLGGDVHTVDDESDEEDDSVPVNILLHSFSTS